MKLKEMIAGLHAQGETGAETTLSVKDLYVLCCYVEILTSGADVPPDERVKMRDNLTALVSWLMQPVGAAERATDAHGRS